MRLNFLPLLLLAPASLAAPIDGTAAVATSEQAPADVRTIENAMRDVIASTNQLTSAIKNLQRDFGRVDTYRDEVEIERAGAKVAKDLRDGADKIRRGPAISDLDATRLVDLMDKMIAASKDTVASWTAAKPAVMRAGGQQAVLRLLNEIEVASSVWTDAITSKMSALSRPIAQAYGQRAKVVRAAAIELFKRG